MENTPLITIMGRPNVGKSTLFNRLTGRWQAIVEDRPGITRDRLMGKFSIGSQGFRLMDTGGLNLKPKDDIEKQMTDQAMAAIEASDLLIFVMDGRAGVTPLDREWVQKFRRLKTPKLYLVNKLDTIKLDERLQEFFELGVEPLIPISFEKQRNFSGLQEAILNRLNLTEQADEEIQDEATTKPSDALTIAIAGRPNVGKSTLLNTLLGEKRSLVHDSPGTTRDPIHSDIIFNNKTYRFIDTAGIRRRAKTVERVEKFSVVASLHSMDDADIVLLMIDGEQGPTEQDAHVAGYAHKKGKTMIILVNKWDQGREKFTPKEFAGRLELKMNYLQSYPVVYISAKTKKNIKKIFETIERITPQFNARIKTGELNRAFENIVEHHPLPVYKGQQIKMYYATQIASGPPCFAVFCNYPQKVHFTYKRYLINSLKEIFGLRDVPVKVLFKGR